LAQVSKFDRITVAPAKCGGKPCIHGLRITVRRVLELVAEHPHREDILKEYLFWKKRTSSKPSAMPPLRLTTKYRA
jgi:Protein of unknown function (DUF433)